MKYNLQTIPIVQIKENPIALRTVDKSSEEYICLRDSIAAKGILNPISVRPIGEEYEIIDGLHRYTAAKESGQSYLPVSILHFDDLQVLEAQLTGNIQYVKTTPLAITKQIHRILEVNPTWSIADLASKLCKSPAWINNRLGLLKLEPTISEDVEKGTINITNAIALAKLPRKEQLDHKEVATAPSERALPILAARVREIKYAKRKGRGPAATFTPVPYYRKMSILKDIQQVNQAASQLIKGAASGEAFALGVLWAINMDPISVEKQVSQYKERQQKIVDDKKERADARIKQQLEEAENNSLKKEIENVK